MTSIPLFLTEEHPCSYLDGHTAQSAFVHPGFELTNPVYSRLMAHGFRRSGDHAYRPQCPGCQKCIPIRLDVEAFKPRRPQKRCWTRNAETQTIIKPAHFEHEHYQLYLRYQNSRHKHGGMGDVSPDEYMNFLNSTWCNTQFVEFKIQEQLVAIAIIDVLHNALSAVYTFFDPDFSRYSPGVYAILWQIDWAKQLKLNWLYLGFWIKECDKMAYKTDYQPFQLYIEHEWRDATEKALSL